MRKWLQKKWHKFCFSHLSDKNVTYDSKKGEIVLKKWLTKVTLVARFIEKPDNDVVPVMQISGDHIVVENSVVEAIWRVLWNTPVTADAGSLTFADVKPHAEPTFLRFRKEVIIPMD